MCSGSISLCLGCSPTGVFSLNVPVEALFFVGNQLIATSHTGKVGVWNAVTKHWQVSCTSCLMAYHKAHFTNSKLSVNMQHFTENCKCHNTQHFTSLFMKSQQLYKSSTKTFSNITKLTKTVPSCKIGFIKMLLL